MVSYFVQLSAISTSQSAHAFSCAVGAAKIQTPGTYNTQPDSFGLQLAAPVQKPKGDRNVKSFQMTNDRQQALRAFSFYKTLVVKNMVEG